MRVSRGHIVAFLAAAALLLAAGPASARDAVVASFDGTQIITHFYPAAGLAPDAQAPTVLVGPPFPLPGSTRPDADDSDHIGAATLRRAGYNVLTWDPRGLGDSSGNVMFDAPGAEGRDVQALVDFVAAQPEALLDAPGDPRAGMSGVSYSGAIQLVAAAFEPRLDAIVPDITWNSLRTSFFKDRALKAGWFTELCNNGEFAADRDGLDSPLGPQRGGLDPTLDQACAEGLTGDVSQANRRWFALRGPGELVARVRIPTLIMQGTADTLFPLSEAVASHRALRGRSVPLKMIWYCAGGHGTCLSAPGDPAVIQRAGLAWLDRWLKRDARVDTGPAFEWIDDAGTWHASASFPLASVGSLDGVGDGSLAIPRSDGAGQHKFATPAAKAVTVRFAAPGVETDALGAPEVKLTYKGRAQPARTFVYAQVVDARADRVVGSQATPIPVTLDGRRHTVQRPLEHIAIRAGPRSDLRLQIVSVSELYGLQTSLGTMRIERADASLPLVAPTVAGVTRSAPQPFRIGVSTRRADGFVALTMRARLRSQPCEGRVTFRVRAGDSRRVETATAGADCLARAVLRVKARGGRRVRVSARFDGSATLRPRTARNVVVFTLG